MNVDLPAALEDDLAATAEQEGLPVDEAVVRAVADWIRQRKEHRVRVQTLIGEVMAEDAALLDRLGDA